MNKEVSNFFNDSQHDVLEVFKDSGYTFIKHGYNEDNNRLDMIKNDKNLNKNIKKLANKFKF